ncbi:WD and tetratricopeptide repeats protein 1 [Fragariocoptes setiger]|uniref:WD and tetratricopeptide repeats protein 1 n=1 Tax=Fragariocoptes setiger TaxID=1670756 RepID=A0ABQ7SB68_9ACAR|nr:WD and tetratricopeptide repeats protein 1 [Fragariocoptes setiger]
MKAKYQQQHNHRIKCSNILSVLKNRSIGNISSIQCRRRLQITPHLIDRFALEAELWGHYGCVNTLEFNEHGSILASGSDDQDVILWNPFARKKLKTVSTGHTGNIFSVKFLPHSNDTIIATGAGDRLVKVFDTSVNDTLLDCSCHAGRVKRIATVAESHFLLWSAGEDGKILQFDLRQPHVCSTSSPSNILISLEGDIQNIEAKCIAVNPVRTELLAVGSNDPFVRLYDRRYINVEQRPQQEQSNARSQKTSFGSPSHGSNSDISSNLSNNSSNYHEHSFDSNQGTKSSLNGCLSYFSPGHLHDKPFKEAYSSTYVTFSPDGQELLANIGAEHVYLFNVIAPDEKFKFQRFKSDVTLARCDCQLSSTHKESRLPLSLNNNSSRLSSTGRYSQACASQREQIETRVLALRKRVKLQLRAKEYSTAIKICNELIADINNHSKLYKLRSEAYMQRNWRGDKYAAVRDASISILLNPTYFKAYIILVHCLKDLDWFEEAWGCYNLMLSSIPEINEKCNKDLLQKLREELELAEHDRKNQAAPNGDDNYGESDFEKLVNDPISEDVDFVILGDRDDVRALFTRDSWSYDSVTTPRDDSQFQIYSRPPSRYINNNFSIDMDDDRHISGDSDESGHESATGSSSVVSLGNVSGGQSDLELARRLQSHDYHKRFCGHCNITTDIKEANFFGGDGQYIVAGSDDGAFFIWDKTTTNLLKAFKGDDQIVNCLQPHPDICLLATSGIDHVVRLWSPTGTIRDREIVDTGLAASINQQRMSCDPIEALFMSFSTPTHLGRE